MDIEINILKIIDKFVQRIIVRYNPNIQNNGIATPIDNNTGKGLKSFNKIN